MNTLARVQATMVVVTDLVVMSCVIVASVWLIGVIVDSVYAAITNTKRRFRKPVAA